MRFHVARISTVLFLVLVGGGQSRAEVVATWLFDEQREVYPSSILNDAGPGRHVLALGRGARLAEGRFGNALEPVEPEPLEITGKSVRPGSESARLFGLVPLPVPAGRTVQPLWWGNATFAAFLTAGEKHLRSGGFSNATETKLNLGAFDWTLEFWFRPGAGTGEGVVYEVGAGPRGENGVVTRLSLAADRKAFLLENQPSGTQLRIPTQLGGGAAWRHLAFVYTAGERQLRHYVDGKPQPQPAKAELQALPRGEEAYLSIGRDGRFERPLAGRIDELRVSAGAVYTAAFAPPGSHSLTYSGRLPAVKLKQGPPLLFDGKTRAAVVELGSRKHLFLDDAFLESHENIVFVPNPPKRMEKVADEVRGHLCVVEDEQGVLKLYYRGPDDMLMLMTSRDGVHWEKPDLGREFHGQRNVALADKVGLGAVFLDPNAPPESRYKYVSGVRRRPVYVFTSKDGTWFEPHETPALPFAAGSQSTIYYDDQRQLYAVHHRSDYGMTEGGATERRFVLSEVKNLLEPWPFERITPEKTRAAAKTMRIQNGDLDPWYLDNGPLSPGGFGIDLPTAFAADPKLDPPGTDIYVTKAIKYPWAPDAYLAFPAVYFHYWEDGPVQRQILGAPERKAGSGVIETQLAVSRDGLSWKRFPRPAYVPTAGTEVMLFVTFGLVRRGDEIWQFVGGHGGSGTGYHSPWTGGKPAPLYRYVQRLDGFAAAEAAYTGGTMTTRPFRFAGKYLELNIDTGAVGYAQVGLAGANGRPVPGYSADDCVYINGDFLRKRVEWLGRGEDLSAFAGQTVQLQIRMRGAKLFAMQFVGE